VNFCILVAKMKKSDAVLVITFLRDCDEKRGVLGKKVVLMLPEISYRKCVLKRIRQ
jgi:hypothetical protein